MIRFAVMTDLHTDIIHDAQRRVHAFVQEANAAGCDFAIQLGDFIQPEFIGAADCSKDRISAVMTNILAGKGMQAEEKRRLWEELREFHGSLYHVLGNHDLDLYTKEEIMSYWGMPAPYYSFDREDIHFVVLDANYAEENGREIPFARGNYMKWMFQEKEPFPCVPESELSWLKQDLQNTDKPSVVFCHEGLNGGFLNAVNHERIFEVLKNAPSGVLLCICGHKHENLFEEEQGIPVYYVNSMSGYSVPPAYARKRFDEETEARYPNVQYMCAYKDPLFVIVSVDEEKISIKGRSSSFVPPSPQEIPVKLNPVITYSAEAASVEIRR